MTEKRLKYLCEQLGDSTPAYIFDLDILSDRMNVLNKKKAGNAGLCYAMKANPFLVKPMETMVDYFEVCSPGELSICQEKQIAPEKIIFSGVNKRKEEIMEAVRYGVFAVTLESWQQYRFTVECAEELKKKVRVMPRLTGGGQFGMEKAELERIIEESSRNEFFEVAGIHYFSGTQKKKAEKILEEARGLKDYADDLKKRLGFAADILEFGTGMAVPYFEGEDFEEELQAFEQLAAFLETEGSSYFWNLEFGRYFAASCGYFITAVVDLKKNHDVNYCLVDGGIHHLNYYGQNMAMRVPKITHVKGTGDDTDSGAKEWCVCGSLCTFADVLVRKAVFENMEVGDMLVFHNAGAYAVTEAIFMLLSRKMPRIYFFREEEGLVLIRDWVETFRLNSDMLS